MGAIEGTDELELRIPRACSLAPTMHQREA
jgi:hypothetical protein